jgi:flagellar motor switch protein FliM
MAGLLSQDEIDVLMGAIAGGDVPAARPARGGKTSRVPKSVRSYDFAHAAIFSRDQLAALQAAHDRMALAVAEDLSSMLRTVVQAKCIGVDQLPYKEFISSQPNPCPCLKLSVKNSEHFILMAINTSIGSGVLDRLAGGPGVPEVLTRAFTDLEMTLLEDLFNKMQELVNEAWMRHGGSFSLANVDSNPQMAQLVLASETVAVATIEVSFAQTQGMVCICYPASVVGLIKENKPAKSAADGTKAVATPKSREKTEQVISKIPLRMVATLGTARLTLSEVLQITAGDVIPLQRAIHEHIDIEVGGRVRFKGFLGAHHGKKAVLIDARIDGPEKE